MPIIKPILDLRNKSNEISELAHNVNEPIILQKMQLTEKDNKLQKNGEYKLFCKWNFTLYS